jgi:hypothetical protein
MMLAHYLWGLTPGGTRELGSGSRPSCRGLGPADAGDLEGAEAKRAPRRARTGRSVHPLDSEEAAAAVGIKRSSIGRALESVIANADVIHDDDKPRLTDPMFEYWLQSRGLTPAGADEEDEEDGG